jgi:hypothetical protein
MELTASAIVFPYDESAAPWISGLGADVLQHSLNPFAAVVPADFALSYVGDRKL